MTESDPGNQGAGPTWALAVGGFLAAVLALLLPWWVIRIYENGEPVNTSGFALFRPVEPVTTIWPHITGALLVIALGIVLVRVAGQSWAYEPKIWRRDLGIAAALCALAVASVLFWPDSVGHFWGDRVAQTEDRSYLESARAGLGWWSTLLATGLLAAAAWVPPRDTSGK